MNRKIEYGLYKPGLLRRRQQHQQRQHALQERALAEAARLARMLVAEFGAEAVYALGPLTYHAFADGMPLELAVVGLTADGFARALAHVKHDSALPVELIDLAQADSWTIHAIARRGKLLAGRAA
jgi:hypothetical protein